MNGEAGARIACNQAQGVAVRLEQCGKTFADGTRALDPLTLEIARGETVVFLGPSGCGKTTTLRIIAGLEQPDPGGRVLFDERTSLVFRSSAGTSEWCSSPTRCFRT